jgi:hypothetical protein
LFVQVVEVVLWQVRDGELQFVVLLEGSGAHSQADPLVELLTLSLFTLLAAMFAVTGSAAVLAVSALLLVFVASWLGY